MFFDFPSHVNNQTETETVSSNNNNVQHNHRKKIRMTKYAPDWTPILEFDHVITRTHT